MQRVAVVRFPGSNCDYDSLRAAAYVGAEAYFVWHGETDLRAADAVVLPGGFSYGDYLRAGAIARFSPVMQAVQRHAAEGGPVFGICNGFQILCEAGLLPGALVRNAGLRFVSKPVDLRVERPDTVFTSEYAPGERIRLPVSHGEGRYVADDATLALLEGEGRVVLRYLPDAMGVEPNPNGSTRDIAGICNAAGTVVGIMPHPDRAWTTSLGSTDGLRFFTSMTAWQPAAPGRS
ncbi:MAG: phosphoribosylformylglycinamidine synthase subunit PurQ [Gemmatimonadales bacterium]